jgi:hypothetical protein
MKRRYMAEQFDDYRRKVIPRDAHPVQVTECKRAFFAGALAIQSVIMANLTPGPDSSPADEEMMMDLTEELEEFGKRGGV